MSSNSDSYTFEILDRPGLTLSPAARKKLARDLRDLASTCLHPLPDYQCLSSAPDALDDKLIVTMRAGRSSRLVAFVSAVYLAIALHAGSAPSTVLHTGLTCVAPALRRQGATQPLFAHLFMHLRAAFPAGLWVTSLAEVPGTLGSLAEVATDVFPSPACAAPSDVHLRIARAVDARYRGAMRICDAAEFDEEAFVFRGSNPPGSCFRKDSEDGRYHHREQGLTEYYRGLLGRHKGNEVLQVGYLEWGKAFGESTKNKKVEERYGVEVKVRL
ncbi:hypothetical protein PsYK624_076150 [Phanerochaete sordida]|uniref:Uncharacterized protein n=1 Tax=Phanerochaete sordida TaxID=48140 RepID=A0A9P3LDP3_9APHY|nr:hypothetical protein PsYK624_076150 [Phanerochaete sordida]